MTTTQPVTATETELTVDPATFRAARRQATTIPVEKINLARTIRLVEKDGDRLTGRWLVAKPDYWTGSTDGRGKTVTLCWPPVAFADRPDRS